MLISSVTNATRTSPLKPVLLPMMMFDIKAFKSSNVGNVISNVDIQTP